MLLYSSPIANFPPNKAARTPCGGRTNCQRRACPLTGLWDIFTQLIGKLVFGQEFASEMLCVPNCMPNPVVGINYFAFSFFPPLKGIELHHPKHSVLGQRVSSECSATHIFDRPWMGWGGQIIYPRGSSQNKQQSFLTDNGLKGICPVGSNSLLDRALRMTWQIPLRGRGEHYRMLLVHFK